MESPPCVKVVAPTRLERASSIPGQGTAFYASYMPYIFLRGILCCCGRGRQKVPPGRQGGREAGRRPVDGGEGGDGGRERQIFAVRLKGVAVTGPCPLRPGTHQATMLFYVFLGMEKEMSLKQRLGFTKEPLYLMDGTAFLYRGFFANANMNRSDGLPTAPCILWAGCCLNC